MQSAFVLLLVSATVCAVYGQSEYKSAYAVSDPLTGDHKSQKEIGVANGDVVVGQYKTLDADGLMRTVTYKADPLSGFNADVDRSPVGIVPARIFKRQILPFAIDSLTSPPYMNGLYRSDAILPGPSSFSSLRHLTRAGPVVMAAPTPNWQMIGSPAIVPALADPLDWSTALLKK